MYRQQQTRTASLKLALGRVSGIAISLLIGSVIGFWVACASISYQLDITYGHGTQP